MRTISTEKGSKMSVKKLVEVAHEYGYKLEIIHCGQYGKKTAYLWASEPMYRSPYGNHIESVVRSYDYCKKLFYKYE